MEIEEEQQEENLGNTLYEVYSWGNREYAGFPPETGPPSRVPILLPRLLPSLSHQHIVQVACSSVHSLARSCK